MLLCFASIVIAADSNGTPYVRPKIIDDGGQLVIKQGRHPIIEKLFEAKVAP